MISSQHLKRVFDALLVKGTADALKFSTVLARGTAYSGHVTELTASFKDLKRQEIVGSLDFNQKQVANSSMRNNLQQLVTELLESGQVVSLANAKYVAGEFNEWAHLFPDNANSATVTGNNTTLIQGAVGSTIVINSNTTPESAPTATVKAEVNSKYFELSVEEYHAIGPFFLVLKDAVIFSAQTNMVLPEIHEKVISIVNETIGLAVDFVSNEDELEREELIHALAEYEIELLDLKKTAEREIRKANNAEKKGVAAILSADLPKLKDFKEAWKALKALGKEHLAGEEPIKLPSTETGIRMLKRKYIRLANK